MQYVGLALADLFQVHLWPAIALGLVVARRSQSRWAAVGLATAFYSASTSALSLLGWGPNPTAVAWLFHRRRLLRISLAQRA